MKSRSIVILTGCPGCPQGQSQIMFSSIVKLSSIPLGFICILVCHSLEFAGHSVAYDQQENFASRKTKLRGILRRTDEFVRFTQVPVMLLRIRRRSPLVIPRIFVVLSIRRSSPNIGSSISHRSSSAHYPSSLWN